MLLDRYQGDLRKLREAAGRDPQEERRLLEEFKGIGDVGADIFMREVQLVWDELYPFADRRGLSAAARLGLGDSAQALSAFVDRADFPRRWPPWCGSISASTMTRSSRRLRADPSKPAKRPSDWCALIRSAGKNLLGGSSFAQDPRRRPCRERHPEALSKVIRLGIGEGVLRPVADRAGVRNAGLLHFADEGLHLVGGHHRIGLAGKHQHLRLHLARLRRRQARPP